MDARRQHNGMHAPLQSQQFPPLLQQGGGHPPRLPLPLPHPNMGFNPRPSSFSGPLAGQKRNSRYSDSGGSTKLFVASLPRNISEDEVRELFGGFGNVLEVIFLKDKKTGLPQGCCFVKYTNAMDAERAIRALDNQRTLPGGPAPLQVKFADGERDHSGPMEYKLFVGSLNKQATEPEIEEIFAPYGRVENVYIIRDDQKQSRGCAFVTFPERDMAIAAISALNGIYRMSGCHQPIIVRFADPKRPRSGERERDTRMGGSGPNYSPRSHHGGPGTNLNSHSHQGVGGPRGSGGGPAMEGTNPSFGWRQGGGAGGLGLLPQAGILPLGASASATSQKGPLDGPNSGMGIRGVGLSTQAATAISSQVAVSGIGSQMLQQQGLKEPPLQKLGQMFGQPHSVQQSALQQSLANTQQSQLQSIQGYPLAQSTDARLQQQGPIGHYANTQTSVQAQMYSQTSVSHQPLQQQVVTSMQQPISVMSSQPLQYQPLRPQESQPNQQMQAAHPVQQISLQPLQPQVTKETSQQPYLQPLQLLSQTNQQPVSLQPSWSVPVQQQAMPSQQQALPVQQVPVTSQPHAVLSQQQAMPLRQQAVPLQLQAVSLQQQAAPSITTAVTTSASTTPVTNCEWTEHTSPDGHKYYYNSKSGESRWEKPEEFAAFERQQQQQQQMLLAQQQQQQQQQQSQLVQPQLQTHVQNLQPQQISSQFQQQQLLNHQPQQGQPFQQQSQPQVQQVHQQSQLQQPQLQHLPQLQQIQQQVQLQQLQHQQPQLQQVQRDAQFNSAGLQFSQLPTSGGAYQAQGYTHLQPASQPANQSANGMVDASRATQFPANGVSDASRGAQWMPAMQQGSLNQDWMWKSKPAGS